MAMPSAAANRSPRSDVPRLIPLTVALVGHFSTVLRWVDESQMPWSALVSATTTAWPSEVMATCWALKTPSTLIAACWVIKPPLMVRPVTQSSITLSLSVSQECRITALVPVASAAMAWQSPLSKAVLASETLGSYLIATSVSSAPTLLMQSSTPPGIVAMAEPLPSCRPVIFLGVLPRP